MVLTLHTLVAQLPSLAFFTGIVTQRSAIQMLPEKARKALDALVKRYKLSGHDSIKPDNEKTYTEEEIYLAIRIPHLQDLYKNHGENWKFVYNKQIAGEPTKLDRLILNIKSEELKNCDFSNYNVHIPEEERKQNILHHFEPETVVIDFSKSDYFGDGDPPVSVMMTHP